jgi:hypothetical protein
VNGVIPEEFQALDFHLYLFDSFVVFKMIFFSLQNKKIKKHSTKERVHRANNVASILHHLVWNGAWSGSFVPSRQRPGSQRGNVGVGEKKK